MSRVSAPTGKAASTRGILRESAPAQKSTSPTVMEQILSRLKDIGITKVFGVAGDFAFPIEDAIVGFRGVDWIGRLTRIIRGDRPFPLRSRKTLRMCSSPPPARATTMA
jgi:hypothetical protein